MNARQLMIILVVLVGFGCEGDPTPPPASSTPAPPPAPAPEPNPHASLFAALPAAPATASAARIDLGRMLYMDKRLSKNHDIACASCHPLDGFGADGQPTSPGHKGARGTRNSPTTLNSALNVAQFWDGRAATLADQAKGPVLNPVEMAHKDEASVVIILQTIPGYVTAFAAAFPDADPPLSYDTMAEAIAVFEAGLVTPSRFDAWLSGTPDALTEAELVGLDTFVRTGCTACHAGVGIGGASYQKLGLVKPYPTADEGRFAVTGEEADRFVFKVPSLRNVAQTGPWLHDGSVTDLGEMVALMARFQLGKELQQDEIGAIVTFLGSLTGELDADYGVTPELPASGPNTPKPDPS